MAATTSQNFPRTFRRMETRWNDKIGRRNLSARIWSEEALNRQQAPSYSRVPHLMEPVLSSPDFVDTIKLVSPNTKLSADGEQIWIYNMRSSDALPRTTQDEEKLYAFVRQLIAKSFPISSGRQLVTARSYLEDNIHVAVCFFVWTFTKPNFFYKDKVISQTTRKGIQRVWTPLLLEKEPKTVPISNTTRQATPALKPATTDVQLPKQLQEQSRLRAGIEKIMDGSKLDWEDHTSRHLKISEAINATGPESTISIKNTKKLQKLYNDLTKLEAKINKTQEKIRKVELANSKIVVLGSIPPPPQLNRQPFTYHEGMEAEEEPVQAGCSGCGTNSPNQLVHMGPGGCLDDAEEQVPDSWEDV